MSLQVLKQIGKIYLRGASITFLGSSSLSLLYSYNNPRIKFSDSLTGITVMSAGWPVVFPYMAMFSGDKSIYVIGFWLALILIP